MAVGGQTLHPSLCKGQCEIEISSIACDQASQPSLPNAPSATRKDPERARNLQNPTRFHGALQGQIPQSVNCEREGSMPD